ncbi:MAG: MFS transporter [Planctomycetota bacterium]|nr:MFS transporter [Planctomycetota bacterium]
MATVTGNIDERTRRASLCLAMVNMGCWAAMFGFGESSFGLFAAHVKAPEFFFGLLVGVPNLLGPLVQAASANMLEHFPRRRLFVLVTILTQTLCFVPMAVLPFLPPGMPFWIALCSIVTIYFVMGHFAHPPWSSMISDLVPASERGEYFARQNRVVAAVSLATRLVFGAAIYLAQGYASEGRLPDAGAGLETGRGAGPIAGAGGTGGGAGAAGEIGGAAGTAAVTLATWVFAGSFAAAGISRAAGFFHARRIYDPPFAPSPDTAFTFWQFIKRARESNFVHFVFFVTLIWFGTMVSGPYFLPYFSYELRYPQWQWVALDVTASLASILTFPLWGRFSGRFGNKATLRISAIGISAIPLTWMLCLNPWYLIAVNFFSGTVWSGFTLSVWNYILEAVSPPKRARCIAYLNIVAGAGTFAGSIFGGWLNEILAGCVRPGGGSAPAAPTFPVFDLQYLACTPFMYLLFLSFLLRLGACVLLPTFRELRPDVQPFSLLKWSFEISQIRIPVGIRFDFLHGHENGKNGSGGENEEGKSTGNETGGRPAS